MITDPTTPEETAPFTEAEFRQLRADTPGTANLVHFNNAGASLPPAIVTKAVTDYLHEEALSGGYETEYKYRDALNDTYQRIAQLIHADPAEIALMENASMAWHVAFYGLDLQPGDVVLVSEYEYVSNVLGLISAKQKTGIDLRVIANDAAGNFSLPALAAAITPEVKAIAVTQIAAASGGVLPVAAIGAIARREGIPFLVDACQAVGQVPVNVREMNCDLLVATGRKFLRAPRGTGFLFVRREIQDRLRLFLLDGHSVQSVNRNTFVPRPDARRFELYERNRALTLGLRAAVRYALDLGPERTWRRVQAVAAHLRKQLNAIATVTVHDEGDSLCGIVTFSVAGFPAESVRGRLAENRVNVTVAPASSTMFLMDRRQLTAVVRASVHYYNTLAETERLVGLVRAMGQQEWLADPATAARGMSEKIP